MEGEGAHRWLYGWKLFYLEVIEEVLLLRLKQFPVGRVLQRLVPEAPHIHPGHLRVPKRIKICQVGMNLAINYVYLRILERLHMSAP